MDLRVVWEMSHKPLKGTDMKTKVVITVDTDADELTSMGETLVAEKGGCLLCHKITDTGNVRAPDLRGIGGRAATQVAGQGSEEYLTESLLVPGAVDAVDVPVVAAGGFFDGRGLVAALSRTIFKICSRSAPTNFILGARTVSVP